MTTINRSSHGCDVLVIEDDPRHQEQMRSALQANGFIVQIIDKGDLLRLFNYRAIHKNAHIMVVDLDLGEGAPDPFTSGMALIREHLWAIDRSSIFIVFSRTVTESGMARSLRLLEPQYAFVPKEVQNGSITEKSLNDLVAVTLEAKQLAIADVDPVVHSAQPSLEVMRNFFKRFQKPEWHYRAPVQSLERSIEFLNRLAREVDSYSRSGSDAYHIAIGVYGSYGRLEARSDSDVEFSIFVDDRDYEHRDELCAQFWNRLMTFIRSMPKEVEGFDIVAENLPQLLTKEQTGDPAINGYVPIFRLADVLAGKVLKHPNLRNRSYQLLIEGRAVFNEALFHFMKKEAFLSRSKILGRDPMSVIGTLFWRDMLTQFELDALPRVLTNTKEIKSLCYRGIGALGLRLALIQRLDLEKSDFTTDDDWNKFFDLLGEPSVLKLMRFALALQHRDSNGLADKTAQLVTLLSTVLARLEGMTLGPDTHSADNDLTEIIRDAHLVANYAVDILENISASTANFSLSSSRPWMTASSGLKELTSR